MSITAKNKSLDPNWTKSNDIVECTNQVHLISRVCHLSFNLRFLHVMATFRPSQNLRHEELMELMQKRVAPLDTVSIYGNFFVQALNRPTRSASLTTYRLVRRITVTQLTSTPTFIASITYG